MPLNKSSSLLHVQVEEWRVHDGDKGISIRDAFLGDILPTSCTLGMLVSTRLFMNKAKENEEAKNVFITNFECNQNNYAKNCEKAPMATPDSKKQPLHFLSTLTFCFFSNACEESRRFVSRGMSIPHCNSPLPLSSSTSRGYRKVLPRTT